VWFGERWIDSVYDQFEENLRYFPALLPVCSDEDPEAVLASGHAPGLDEMRMHNGTIYRWNRPVYAVHDGRAHLRIENRVLPAGPTVVDILANAALYYGLVRSLAAAEVPVWTQMSFAAAQENFTRAARDGIGATLYWPGLGDVLVTDLVRRELLPAAYDGLRDHGVDASVAARLLGIIEARCSTRRNGATWQIAMVEALQSRTGLDRTGALRAMLGRYIELMHTNEPIHTWSIEPIGLVG
jgi:hypothetical protein